MFTFISFMWGLYYIQSIRVMFETARKQVSRVVKPWRNFYRKLLRKCFNSLGPSDTYMHQWSSLVQIMVCRLVGNKPVFKLLPEYMLNGSGVYVKWVTGNYFQLYSNRNEYIFIQKNPFANVACEMASILSRPQCVKYMIDSWFCKHYMELHVSTITTL